MDMIIPIVAGLVAGCIIGWLLSYLRSGGSNISQSSIDTLDKNLERVENSIKDEFTRNREEINKNSRETREELTNSLLKRMTEIAGLQKDQLDIFSKQLTALTKTNEDKLDKIIQVVESKLKSIQDDNNEKLEKMRVTVDEKLHKTLESKLGESFKIVSERLEQVHKGLGEMQTLATGVGDLKKVLSNVKTRGSLGEYQLENILEQILAPDQYAKNVQTKKRSRETVEFAIKLPGREDKEKTVWLPLDSKFPQDKYQYLLDAYETANSDVIEQAVKDLEKSIKTSAKDIKEKYLDPPNTTDFGIMFLPFEGLYAEVVKRPALFETLQREFRITVTGPSTLAAFLNSLQMGFRTLAIEKRSSEVWALLGAVKTEFGKFGTVLDGVHKNLTAASNKILQAGTKSRNIERKLKNVQELPVRDAVKYLEDSADLEDEEEDETV
jgi:DNA recombination protein RmuC